MDLRLIAAQLLALDRLLPRLRAGEDALGPLARHRLIRPLRSLAGARLRAGGRGRAFTSPAPRPLVLIIIVPTTATTGLVAQQA
ncbi:MAG TPA: hypothetical protein VM759_09390, partial [Longimicrobium sp.]|nr:hypothetical protein [Longimicrobium sp.]